MAAQLERPMSEFSAVSAESSPGRLADQDPHPNDASIVTPDDAAVFLAGERVDIGASSEGMHLGAGADERRCAWLTGGGSPDERYVLNWSGTLDSNWDYVTFGFEMLSNGQVHSVTDDGGLGYAWQWACRGNSFEVSWTPRNLAAYPGFNPRAVYAVWSKSLGGYLGLAPCN
jgi:hypothetical protein